MQRWMQVHNDRLSRDRKFRVAHGRNFRAWTPVAPADVALPKCGALIGSAGRDSAAPGHLAVSPSEGLASYARTKWK
jgi:hypothetical protein